MKDIEKLLEKAHLNWEVHLEETQTKSGIIIPNQVAVVRDDTKAILGKHTPQYELYQNYELLELLHKISTHTGLQMHSGGYFGQGERVWYQLKSNDLNLPGGDKLEGFVTGLNTFDGSKRLAFGNSFITISCRNTWMRAYQEVENHLKHTKTMKPRIEAILKQISLILTEEQTTFEQVRILNDFRMDAKTELMVLAKLFDLEKEESLDELSGAKLNKIKLFSDILALETAQKGDNLWGLFSGVTRWTTHEMSRGDNTEAKIFGNVGKLEQKIYSSLLEVAVG